MEFKTNRPCAIHTNPFKFSASSQYIMLRLALLFLELRFFLTAVLNILQSLHHLTSTLHQNIDTRISAETAFKQRVKTSRPVMSCKSSVCTGSRPCHTAKSPSHRYSATALLRKRVVCNSVTGQNMSRAREVRLCGRAKAMVL